MGQYSPKGIAEIENHNLCMDGRLLKSCGIRTNTPHVVSYRQELGLDRTIGSTTDDGERRNLL